MTMLKKWFQDNAIEEVEVLIPDIAGMARGKFVPAQRYLAGKGIRIAKGLFTQTITGDYIELVESINPADIDMEARPVAESRHIVPWAPYPTAQIIHDCYHLDGTPVEIAPRQVLKRALEFYDKQGWEAVVAPEIEFYLVKVNTDADLPLEPPVGRSGRQEQARRTFSIDALNEFENVVEDIYDFAEQQELDIETLSHEDGIAQLEVNFLHGDPMSLADQVFTFKRTVREAAFKHNMYATFMAKPHQDQPGSSMHLHQSVVDKKTGRNIFASNNGKPSKLFMSYIAGLQKYLSATMPLFAPNVNSYRRVTRYYASPINTHWGFDNRTVGLRVPLAPAAATRVENRVPGADTNPYLAIAASLGAGYLGMEEKLEPTKPLEGSAHERAITLPRDLHTALKFMRRSTPLRSLLGEEFIRVYIAVKELEYETFFQVISSWEREHLLLNV